MSEPLAYPAVGDETGAHTIIVTTMGDMNVPASSGLSVSRAAGFIEYRKPAEKYEGTEFEGLSENQILIETGTAEAVHTLARFVDVDGNPVHYDIENFSEGADIYADREIPRLDPPLRARLDEEDANGGVSGAMFLFVSPEGWHGFSTPGQEHGIAQADCRDECGDDDECRTACYEALEDEYDGGYFMATALGEFFATGGKVFNMNSCQGRRDCDEAPVPPPPTRETAEAFRGEVVASPDTLENR